jgi:biotin carboxyl carrier protein
MKPSLRAAGLAIVVIGLAAWLIVRYREHRREVSLEAQRDAPVVAASRVTERDGAAVVALDSAEARRVGLTLAALRAAPAEREARFPAEIVPEAERVSVLRAPIAGRFTLPPGARWPGLGERVRAGEAIAQVSDARPLTLPIGGVVTRVGAQPGALVEAGQALLEVADYSHPLVRVGWSGDGAPPARLSIAADERGPRVTARLVGPAPEPDPVTRRAAYLYRAARGWPGGTPGAAALAIAMTPAAGAGGALIPDSAVVQWEGLAWVYRQRDAGRFERVRVETTSPVPGGWAAGAPFAAGDSVVIRGAQELLSEEFRARVTVGDESGE